MFLVPQGQNPVKMVEMLEKRVEALENLVKGLQEKNARMGRPPKNAKNEEDQRCISDTKLT